MPAPAAPPFLLRSAAAMLALILSACGATEDANATPPWQTSDERPNGDGTGQPGSSDDGDDTAASDDGDGQPGSSDDGDDTAASDDGAPGDGAAQTGDDVTGSEGPGDLALDPTGDDPGAQPGGPVPETRLDASEPPAPTAGGTRNLFTDLLGLSETEVEAKVVRAVNRVFGIGTGESSTPQQNDGYRLYYELPQDPSMAFLWAADTQDIRSEGMSYGMMIAVQMGLRQQFDRLWKFSQTFMQFPADSNLTSWRRYFRWQGRVNTGNAQNWAVNYAAQTGPAPDGEEYFAAALYLADRRWGSGGGVNYLADANDVARAMLHNPRAQNRTPVIHPDRNMVVFYPNGNTANYSDPSYHLPAFYDLFALDGPSEDAQRWREIAEVSRSFLVSSAHPQTGLHPDYANFDGSPNSGGSDHNRFKFDAWRVIMNMGVDYAWFSGDARMQQQAEKYHAFFATRLRGNDVENQIFNLDGSNASDGGSTALTATLAAGALASAAPNREVYVRNLWNVQQQQGFYRYYQESVYVLGLLATAGRMRYDFTGVE